MVAQKKSIKRKVGAALDGYTNTGQYLKTY